jgi:hypothetical protein
MSNTKTENYEINYAYPLSEMAKQLKRGGEGCYYIKLCGFSTNEAFGTLEEATKAAQNTGYTPSFYSLDIFKGGY